MRGKGKKETRSFKAAGITPAYAGKSLTLIDFQFEFQDHPRLCGEKISTFASGVVASGSPPPMRGKAGRIR